MNDLKDIFLKRLEVKGIAKQVTAAMICDAFDKSLVEFFGKDILKEAKAVSFRCGTLKVKVSSPSLSQEVQGHWGKLMDENAKIKKFIFEVI